MEQEGQDQDGEVEEYEPPAIEDLDTGDGPAVTAAGTSGTIGAE